MDLYKFIDEKLCISIILKNRKEIKNVKPIKIYFNDDLKNWYLVFKSRGRIEYLRLENMNSIKTSKDCFKDEDVLSYDWGFGSKAIKVKLRVFNEKNTKELVVRFLSRKNIIYEKPGENYFDLVVLVSHLNLFKRWLRGMGPHIIVLEPEFLREDMNKQIKLWSESYGV